MGSLSTLDINGNVLDGLGDSTAAGFSDGVGSTVQDLRMTGGFGDAVTGGGEVGEGLAPRGCHLSNTVALRAPGTDRSGVVWVDEGGL